MNVDEYFPEGLSVIQPDDTQLGQKKASQNRILASSHCHICYKSSGTINNVDYIKQCACQLIFVHRSCAKKNESKFREEKCSNCGEASTIPRFARLQNIRKVGSAPAALPGQTCALCQSPSYHQVDPDENSILGVMVKPCFCRTVYHFGCLSKALEDKTSCSECSVIYTSFEPAPNSLYFIRHWLFYTFYITVLAILSTLLFIAFNNSIVFTNTASSTGIVDRELALTFISVFFLVIIVASMFCVIKYTVCSALPHFRISRGKVMLKSFRIVGKPTEKLETLREDEFEDVALNERKSSEIEKENDGVETARGGYEPDDMTLGQHMFGVYETHHSSSTPIERPPLAFAFNSA